MAPPPATPPGLTTQLRGSTGKGNRKQRPHSLYVTTLEKSMGSLSSPRSDTDKHDANNGDGFIKAEVVDQTIQGITFPKKVSCFSLCLLAHKFSRS